MVSAYPRIWIASLVWIVLISGLVAMRSAAAGASAAPPLAGNWDVVKVGAGDDQQHRGYRPDDPATKYRVLVIGPSEVTLNDRTDACDLPFWKSAGRSHLYQWVEGTYARAVKGSDAATFLQQLDLAYDDQIFHIDKRLKPWLGDREITLLKLSCGPKTAQRAQNDWHDYTFISVSPDTLLLDDGGEGLWRLQKRKPGSAIQPSYACARVATPAEIAICQDYELAGYDRSVAEAFRWVIYLNRDDSKQIAAEKREQTAWIAKRDACGATRNCLVEQMSQRISDLMQEANSGAFGG